MNFWGYNKFTENLWSYRKPLYCYVAVIHHLPISSHYLLLHFKQSVLPNMHPPWACSSQGIVIETASLRGKKGSCHLQTTTSIRMLINFFSTQLPINLRCGGRICCVNDCLRHFPRNQGPESKLKNNPQSHIKIWRGYIPTKQFWFSPNCFFFFFASNQEYRLQHT